ncbi:MAG: hypothetical protein WCK18_14115 [Prolixibacteraceae bacterium]
MKKFLSAFILFFVIFQLHAQLPGSTDGIPYTRTAFPAATNAIKDYIAFFDGSRYAFIYGKKVRLSNLDLLRGEAFSENGKLFIPVSFAGALLQKQLKTEKIPSGLEILSDRWVYQLSLPETKIPSEIELRIKGAEKYFAVEDWAKKLGKSVYKDQSGLLLISDGQISYNGKNSHLAECVTALFDTPEKYMNPDLAIKYIPWLNTQKKWTDHAKATPEQLELLEKGPEKEWSTVPNSEFNFSGFNFKLLGSKVPAPGIYPRLLFSPEDIPMMQNQVKSNKAAMKSMVEIEFLLGKSWLNEASSDGKIFNLLASGDVAKIRSQMDPPVEGPAVYAVPRLTKDHQPVIFNTHINYVTNCLSTMALYALLTNNDQLGKKTAAAIVTYFKLIEPNVEKHLRTSDSEFGATFDGGNHSTTHWRGMHGVIPHMDMAFALDFSGKWMTPEQKKFMQNLIAKTTYGRRTGGGDGPRRAWRDINHVTWHLTHLISLAAIEGLDGFDPEGYASGAELTRDFLDWGIDRNGQVFESNGKSGGGIQFEFLSMVILARRGDNLFGHPHLRKLLEAQTEITTPNSERTVTSGTWSGGPLAAQTVGELKAFYPQNKFNDYLLTNAYPTFDPSNFNAESYRLKLEKEGLSRLRLPGPTYPDMVFGFPYIADWKITKREDLNLKLDWDTDEYGMFSSSSDKTDKAVWMNLQVRQNTYIGSGHHHSDIGMFHFSGLGVNWFTESPFPKEYDAKYHNLVGIDGISESDQTPAKGDYLGASFLPDGAVGTADLSYSYNWKWCTQVKNWGEGFATLAKGQPYRDFAYELETRPEILEIFRGTTKYKMRPWWATSNQANFIPTLRTPWNPVEYVYRSAGVVRGKHSYGILVDDLKKDAKDHLYQWTGIFGKGVWKTNFKADYKNAVVLGYNKDLQGNDFNKPSAAKLETINPVKGTPMLLVYYAGAGGNENFKVEIMDDGPVNKETHDKYCRLSIDQSSVQANYRLLLIPFVFGEDLPVITEEKGEVSIQWKDQTDIVNFKQAQDNRTRFNVVRNNKIVVYSK